MRAKLRQGQEVVYADDGWCEMKNLNCGEGSLKGEFVASR